MIAVAVLVPAGASASSTTHILHYEGRFLGLPVMKSQLALTKGEGDYDAQVDFQAAGLAGFFVKSVVKARSSGAVQAGQLVARSYQHTEITPGKTRSVLVDRTGPEARVTVTPPFGNLGDPEPSAHQINEATDPLAALLNLGLNGCTRPVRVFDSRLRYDLDVKTPPNAKAPNRCQIGYEPIAGFDAEDMNDPEPYQSVVNVRLRSLPEGLSVIEAMDARISGLPVSIRLKKAEVVSPRT
jgi:hypothetical protein